MNVNARLTKGGSMYLADCLPGQFLLLLVACVGSIMPSARRARGCVEYLPSFLMRYCDSLFRR